MKPVENTPIPLPTTPKEYVEFEQAANFQIGEMVRVFRSARTNEGGWNNSWNSDMDVFVGRSYHIYSVGHANGSGIGLSSFRFPYFILERVVREEDSNV